ncbi:MAG: DUF2934 domain-containing protein [Bacteroidales bacterium]|nr:DUF2934 domain-containing protein [Bacteroidales bacterium]
MERKSNATKSASQKPSVADTQSKAMKPTKQPTGSKKKSGNKDTTAESVFPTGEHQVDLEEKIRQRAHQISHEKDNAANSEMENWLQAEREIKDDKWKTDNYSQNL